jgi:hypothetical protein
VISDIVGVKNVFGLSARLHDWIFQLQNRNIGVATTLMELLASRDITTVARLSDLLHQLSAVPSLLNPFVGRWDSAIEIASGFDASSEIEFRVIQNMSYLMQFAGIETICRHYLMVGVAGTTYSLPPWVWRVELCTALDDVAAERYELPRHLEESKMIAQYLWSAPLAAGYVTVLDELVRKSNNRIKQAAIVSELRLFTQKYVQASSQMVDIDKLARSTNSVPSEPDDDEIEGGYEFDPFEVLEPPVEPQPERPAVCGIARTELATSKAFKGTEQPWMRSVITMLRRAAVAAESTSSRTVPREFTEIVEVDALQFLVDYMGDTASVRVALDVNVHGSTKSIGAPSAQNVTPRRLYIHIVQRPADARIIIVVYSKALQGSTYPVKLERICILQSQRDPENILRQVNEAIAMVPAFMNIQLSLSEETFVSVDIGAVSRNHLNIQLALIIFIQRTTNVIDTGTLMQWPTSLPLRIGWVPATCECAAAELNRMHYPSRVLMDWGDIQELLGSQL